MTTDQSEHRVVEDRGWSYVIGPKVKGRDGPWRYRWEAQEEADRYNAPAIDSQIASKFSR
jgi:hypothetical protein